jgi:hypothetical protein
MTRQTVERTNSSLELKYWAPCFGFQNHGSGGRVEVNRFNLWTEILLVLFGNGQNQISANQKHMEALCRRNMGHRNIYSVKQVIGIAFQRGESG